MRGQSREEIEFGGLHNSLAESRTPKGRAYRMSNCTVDRGILEVGPRYRQLGARSGDQAGDVGWGLGYGRFGCNSVFRLTLSGTATGGTFRISWRPTLSDALLATAPIAWNAEASTVLEAMQALSTIDAGDVDVTGGPLPSRALQITFKGRYGQTAVLSPGFAENLLTGSGGPAPTIVTTVVGGIQEEFLAVVQHQGETTARLYSIHPDTGVYTLVASGLNAGAWSFLQYGQRIYAANARDGLLFRTLGGAWSGSSGSSAFRRPVVVPQPSLLWRSPPSVIPAGTTLVASSGWGTAPTVSIADGRIRVTLAAALTDQIVTLTLQLPAAQDLSYQDAWTVDTLALASEVNVDPSGTDLLLTNDDTSPVDIEPLFRSDGTFREGSLTQSIRTFQFADDRRTLRDNVRRMRITLRIQRGVSGKVLTVVPTARFVWMNDTRQGLSINRGPTSRAMEYAYSYFETSTGAESALSAVATTPRPPETSFQGIHVAVGCFGSAELTTADKIRLYRRDDSGTWRLAAEAANVPGAMVTVTDALMLHELRAQDAFGAIQLPGGVFADVLGTFKQCLVVGADLKAWFSGVGRPLAFAPDPEDTRAELPDASDSGRPRTVFVADSRSEEVRGAVGQDSCYLITAQSAYAMVGDTPATLTPPRRLPGSRGSLSKRGTAAFGGGVLVTARDGLFYYSVSRGFSGEDNGALLEREETLETRASWRELVDGGAAASLLAELGGDVWAINGRRYLRISRNRQIEAGEFADSFAAALASRDRGIRLLDTRGRLHLLEEGISTDAGQPVAWSYRTGILTGPRAQIVAFEVHAEGRPRIVVDVDEGGGMRTAAVLDTPAGRRVHRIPVSLAPGWRFRLTFSGTQDDRIEAVAALFDAAPGGRGS